MKVTERILTQFIRNKTESNEMQLGFVGSTDAKNFMKLLKEM